MKINPVEMGLREKQDGVPAGNGELSLQEKLLKIVLEHPEEAFSLLEDESPLGSLVQQVLKSSGPDDVAHIAEVSAKNSAQ